MKPAPFDYARPDSLDEAVELAAQHGSDARFLAGGQSLIAMLNMRVSTPSLLIDISNINDSSHITETSSDLVVGCGVRQATLEKWPALAQQQPLIAEALPWVGHVQTRSRGTVCGSIAHADPASELPLCLATLSGQITLRSQRETRTLSGRQFFRGTLQTARRDDELIVDIRLPRLPDGTGTAFNEMAIRHGDFAIVAVAAVATADGLTIGIGGAGTRPEIRDWPAIEDTALDDALNELAWSIDCQDDLHASARYRRHLIRVLGKRTIEEAMSCRS